MMIAVKTKLNPEYMDEGYTDNSVHNCYTMYRVILKCLDQG
jgi:hypothetical protein